MSEYPIMNKQSKDDQIFVSTTFKATIRETSVYRYYVKLKENVLTEKGFFDLAKVPDLRISEGGQFLRTLRHEKHQKQKDIAKLLNVSCSIVKHWEHNRSNIPLQSLVKILESNGISRDTLYSLIEQGEILLKTKLPGTFEKICELIEYFHPPRKSGTSYRISLTNCSSEILPKILELLNVTPVLHSSCKKIYSKDLYNYFKTFFRYIKVPKIDLPLTQEVNNWHKDVDLKRAIIFPFLQSDGSTAQAKYNYKLNFHGLNKILHNYFVDAMYFEYRLLPTTYFKRTSKNCYVTEYKRKAIKEIIDEIMNLAGNTKTKPANNQTVKEYLKEPQPHLNYLLNASKTEQEIALRIWASAEGCISFYLKNNGCIRPAFIIACAHPDLAKQLQQIARRFNINFTKKQSENTWSKVGWLYNSSINACIEFVKLGGFIKGVKISSKSKHYEGIDKHIFTLGILEFIIRQKNNLKLRNLSLEEVHEELNLILKKREYKTEDYYIAYFSPDDNKKL
ncbi:MAG: helix-turn-helix domain-containing protein [Promethearchaeota archaeon]